MLEHVLYDNVNYELPFKKKDAGEWRKTVTWLRFGSHSCSNINLLTTVTTLCIRRFISKFETVLSGTDIYCP